MWSWLTLAGKYIFTGGANLVKKFTPTGILVTLVGAGLMTAMWLVDRRFTTLLDDNREIAEILRLEEARSKELKRVLESNQVANELIVKELLRNRDFTNELNEKLKGIQNVKHTKETIIREATGECLDSAYPDSVYATFMWGQKENSTPTRDSD